MSVAAASFKASDERSSHREASGARSHCPYMKVDFYLFE